MVCATLWQIRRNASVKRLRVQIRRVISHPPTCVRTVGFEGRAVFLLCNSGMALCTGTVRSFNYEHFPEP